MGRMATKNTTRYYPSIHIREFKRKGWLESQGWRMLTLEVEWRSERHKGKSGLFPTRSGCAIPLHRSLGQPQQYEYAIFFYYAKCNYGTTAVPHRVPSSQPGTSRHHSNCHAAIPSFLLCTLRLLASSSFSRESRKPQ